MIQANELRIGNILKSVHTGEYIKADWLVIKHVMDGNKQSPPYDMSSVYEPIPLTPEILEKCGFEWVKPLIAYTHDDMDCELSLNSEGTENYALHDLNTKGFGGTIPATYYDRKFYLTSNGEYLVSTNPIQFLHQLQNIFYMLTGEELEVKL